MHDESCDTCFEPAAQVYVRSRTFINMTQSTAARLVAGCCIISPKHVVKNDLQQKYGQNKHLLVDFRFINHLQFKSTLMAVFSLHLMKNV
jgi:hypothetical protein